MAKHVARLEGEGYCPYCHRLLKSIIKHNIYTILNHPRTNSEMLKELIHIIYNNVYNTMQNKIVFFEQRTPILLLNDKTFYVSIISDKMTNRFLRNYFMFKWRSRNL